MQGPDNEDPVCAQRAPEPTAALLSTTASMACGSRSPAAISARARSQRRAWPSIALPPLCRSIVIVDVPEAHRARAAAYVITASEGATLHLDRLRTHARDFDPAVRDRLMAGAMIPATLVTKAQKFRRWYQDPPARTVCRSRTSSLPRHALHRTPHRPTNLPARWRRTPRARQSRHLHSADLFHRPAGGRRPGRAHAAAVDVQIIAAPWREDVALRVAHALEKKGVVAAPRPTI